MEGTTNSMARSTTWLNPLSCRRNVNCPLVFFYVVCFWFWFFFPSPKKGSFGRWIKLFSFHL